MRREPDPADARARIVVVTERGRRLLAVVEDVYREREGEWAEVIGVEAVERIRSDRPARRREHATTR